MKHELPLKTFFKRVRLSDVYFLAIFFTKFYVRSITQLGFDIRQKSYALKRSMKLSACKVCYDLIDIDGFHDVMNINVGGKLQRVTRIRKL